MTVYSEFLFLENFTIGFMILILTGKLCARQQNRIRMVLGGILCGSYAFILFVPLPWPAALAGKLLFSFAVILAAFPYEEKRTYIRTVAVFYIVSFLMGGITVGLLYLVKIPALSGNGSIYLHGITWFQIAVGVFVTWILGSWFAEFIRGKLQKERFFTEIQVRIADRTWKLQAFVDTGNFLRDPVSGDPAAVLSSSCGQKIMEEAGEHLLTRICLIPYSSVGQKGILRGIRPDWILIRGKRIERIVLAVSKEEFICGRGTQNYEVLLQQQILEGGALEDGKRLDFEKSTSVGKC